MSIKNDIWKTKIYDFLHKFLNRSYNVEFFFFFSCQRRIDRNKAKLNNNSIKSIIIMNIKICFM